MNVYPFRLRCGQITDINGFRRCGILQQELEINSQEYIDVLPKVLIGLVDPLACSKMGDQNTDGSNCETTQQV